MRLALFWFVSSSSFGPSAHGKSTAPSSSVRNFHHDHFQRRRSKTQSSLHDNEHSNTRRRSTWHEFQALRRVIIICALSCFWWAPYSTVALRFQFGFDDWIIPYLTSSSGLFPKVAACLNPFLYALSSNNCRAKMSFFLNFFQTPARWNEEKRRKKSYGTLMNFIVLMFIIGAQMTIE